MDDLSILIKLDDELAFRLGFHYSQVYLFDGINGLVVNFFQTLCICRHYKKGCE